MQTPPSRKTDDVSRERLRLAAALELEHNRQVSHLNQWADYADTNSVVLAAIEKSVEREKEASPKDSNEDFSEQIITDFFAALNPERLHSHQPMSKELQVLRKVVSTISESRNENILTDEEAAAVLQFILGRFVERRFDRTIKRMLPQQSDSKHWFIRHRQLKFAK